MKSNNLILLFVAALTMSACGENKKSAPPPGPLRVGAAAVVVTPEVETFSDLNENGQYDPGEPFSDADDDGLFEPTWVAGFGNGRDAWGVHDDLFARILVLDQDDQRLAIVSVDWIGLQYGDAMHLKQMAQEAGLELDQLILSSTHNHEGPDTMGIWGESIFSTGRNQEYLDMSFRAIVAGLGQAIEELAPCRIIAGVGQTEGLTHDSRLPDVKDEQLLALRFEALEDDRVLALVAHWSNHPEALGSDNRFITADFPAAIIDTLETAHPGAVGIYWQGMVGGLLNPLHVHLVDEDGQPIPDSSFEKAQRMGQLVGQQALELLAQGQDVSDGGTLSFRQRELLLPIDNEEMLVACQIGLFQRDFFDSEGHPAIPGYVDPLYIKTEVTAIDLGLVQIVTVPGELYPELALTAQDGTTFYQQPQDPGADFQGVECATPIWASMRPTPYKIVLGLANDELGYLVPKCQYDRTAPFAYDRNSAQYGEGFCPGPDVSPMINQALAEELEILNAQWAIDHPPLDP